MSSEHQIAWLALKKGVPVLASDGEELGKVAEVVADEANDIFSGIQVRHGLLGEERFLPADLIADLTEDAVHVNLPADEARARMEDHED